MVKIYYAQDCDLNRLQGKTVAIMGYGSQGHAHALNLKESGVKVVVGLYENPPQKRVKWVWKLKPLRKRQRLRILS